MSLLAEIVTALLSPEAYPEKPAKVEMVQTQMSFAFLTDEHVYKVKKPVNLGYLDYTTLDKRQFYCQREVRLNRRLCPDVYLGMVPITRRKKEISIAGDGKVIEYAVKMRRLPQDRMLDTLLSQNRVPPGAITDIARKLVGFHQKAESNAVISAFGSLDIVIQNNKENFTQTEKYIDRVIPRPQFEHLKEYTQITMVTKKTPFRRRVAEGRIRDCHGDLHAAHICLEDGIQIYDCIEFNDRFRYCDVTSEIAFLAMDLDHHGRTDLSRAFVDAYLNMSRDEEIRELLNFYKCYRACVRGKVNCFQLDDPNIPDEEKEKILTTARGYFDLAESYIETEGRQS